MGYFDDTLRSVGELGILDVLLPFILIFTIVFAVLQKTKIFGTDKVDNEERPKKNFNAVIAFIMGLTTVMPHVMGYYPPERDVVNIINSALPNISVIAVAIVMLLLIIGVFGGDVKIAGTGLANWAVFFAIVAVVVTFGGAAGWFGSLPRWLDFLYDSEIQAIIVVILVFAIVIWFVTKEPKKATGEKTGMWSELGKVMDASNRGGGKGN